MKKISYIFAGQGSQSIGMGKSFYDNSIEARDIFQSASDRLSIDFKKLLFEGTDGQATLSQTQFTQPSILLVASIANKLFQDTYNIAPHFALGHSLGEFSALVSVGALDIIDAIELVHKRGLFMNEACESLDGEAGMMVVLGMSDEDLEKLTQEFRNDGKKIWCANYNNDGQIVLAGMKSHLSEVLDTIKSKGAKRAMLLDMSVASHCPMLALASDKLEELLEKYIKDTFRAPVISNATTSPYASKKEAVDVLKKQLTSPVLYSQSIRLNSADLFIEFGQGMVLKGLNKKLTQTPTININDYDSIALASEHLS